MRRWSYFLGSITSSLLHCSCIYPTTLTIVGITVLTSKFYPVSFMSLRCCSSKCGFWSLCFYSKFLNQRKWISNSTVNENTLKLRILHGVYELPCTVSCLDTCSHGVTTVDGLYAYKIVISSMKNAWKKYRHKIESASLRNVSQWIPLIYVWIYHFGQAVPR